MIGMMKGTCYMLIMFNQFMNLNLMRDFNLDKICNLNMMFLRESMYIKKIKGAKKKLIGTQTKFLRIWKSLKLILMKNSILFRNK